MTPAVVRVREFRKETHDTFTLSLDPPTGRDGFSFLPGQFNMLYAFGIGEVPISMSGDPVKTGAIVHTIRAVGAVTEALAKLRPGSAVGLRGPFGSSWPIETARGCDLVLVCGGIGLAPLRPLIYHIRNNRSEFGKVTLLYGARTPDDVLYREEIEDFRNRGDIQVLLLTVDRADPTWTKAVGLVTSLFSQIDFDPQNTIGAMCGPDIMMHFAAREFFKRSLPEDRLYLSLERNMQCAIGFCGHCQFGPNFVCMDGPVFPYSGIKNFLSVREA